MTPTKIGRYEIKGELGRGGMATVYRAYDPSFEREVAIKVLPRELLHDPQFRDRFRREIKTVASLEHPAIVPVYDVGEEDGVPFFVMRYMPGGSLTQWIEKGKFSMEDAARIIERLSSALAYAHKNGLVHRDLKPDNILFDNNGDPFISDFGVAKITDSASNMTGSGIIGTPAYMSPEQAQGEPVDNRSDIYGLGVIIFQMLSGQQPYEATTPMGVAVKHITDPVPDIRSVNPDLSEATDKVIKTAMAKDRDQRYPTAMDLSRALNQAAFGTKKGAPAAVGAPAAQESAPAASSRRGLLIGGAGLVLLLLVGGAAFLLRNRLATAPAAPASQVTAAAAVPIEQPTEQSTAAPAVSAGPQLAPACPVGSAAAMATPSVVEFQRLCSGQSPNTLLFIDAGATYKSLKQGYTCAESGVREGKREISCTGLSGKGFTIQVCPAPAASSGAGGQCAQGTNYDSANNCCAPPAAKDAGCTVFPVALRGCQ